MAELLVALGDYPHTRPLKDGEVVVDGCTCTFVEVEPINRAFAPMVRELRYDICELAIATYLQAREAGVPLTMLPLVMNGDGHHRSLNRRPDREPLAPADLVGRRVGVRSWSQTTGLWVRGLLREEHGIEAETITWVTTEGSHVAGAPEPEWVQRVDSTVASLVADDAVDAAIIGPRAVAAQGITLDPVFDDPDAADEAWIARHGTIPVNHLVVARTELARREPEAVAAFYRALSGAIADTAARRDDSAHGRAVRAGWSDELRSAVGIAARFGVEQDLLREPLDIEALERESAFLAL